MAKIKKNLEKAISEQDSYAFLKACEYEGISPFEADPYLSERAEAEGIFDRDGEERMRNLYPSLFGKFDYKSFGEDVNANSVRVFNVYSDIEEKIRIYNKHGRTKLKAKNRSISLNELPSVVVGMAFLRDYRNYLKNYRGR